jgi:hypothetical protein
MAANLFRRRDRAVPCTGIIHGGAGGGGVRHDEIDTDRREWGLRHFVTARRVLAGMQGYEDRGPRDVSGSLQLEDAEGRPTLDAFQRDVDEPGRGVHRDRVRVRRAVLGQ